MATNLNGKYVLTFTTGNNVTLWSSPMLEDFQDDSQMKQERVRCYSLSILGANVGGLPTLGCN